MTNLVGKPPLGIKPDPPVRSKRYLALVRQLPCAVCGAPPPSHAHHPICGRYGNEKVSDLDAIPLCPWHHQHGPDSVHGGRTAWLQKYGDDRDYIKPTQEAIQRISNRRK
jgi:hypothetical protein